MEEVWKDIKGYEGLYQVSNLGNVRSLDYRGRGYTKNLSAKRMGQYLGVGLCDGSKNRSISMFIDWWRFILWMATKMDLL